MTLFEIALCAAGMLCLGILIHAKRNNPMKKLKRKPTRKPRVTDAQKLEAFQQAHPNVVAAIRDRRAVIHWPATLDKLQTLRNYVSTSYGVANPGDPNTQRYIDVAAYVTNAAGQWPLCSCGSLCRAIPRSPSLSGQPGAPKDHTLKMHGLAFYESLKQGDITSARSHMEKIEARAAVLLRRMGKKKINYPDLD